MENSQSDSKAIAGSLPRRVRARIEKKLQKAAELLEEALLIAANNGWPDAVGFVSGEGPYALLNVIESQDIRNAYNSTPPPTQFIHAEADGWDCGAW